ncbi:MAG: hypothetical protein ACR2G7_12610 [Acidimicrobiales bacterium]
MARVVVRVWLPDRPGALGLVASRIGGVRGEILGIEILEHGAGRAVDELVVDLPDPVSLKLFVAEISAVDGVDVEDVRAAAPSRRDPRVDALETAATLMAAATVPEVLSSLAAHSRCDLEAEWSAVIECRGPVVAMSGDLLPEVGWLCAFIEGSRSSARVASGESGPDDVALAPMVSAGLDLVLGRRGRPFRTRERHQLGALARLADIRWRQIGAPGDIVPLGVTSMDGPKASLA